MISFIKNGNVVQQINEFIKERLIIMNITKKIALATGFVGLLGSNALFAADIAAAKIAFIDVEKIRDNDEEYASKKDELQEEINVIRKEFEKLENQQRSLQAKLKSDDITDQAKEKIAMEMAKLQQDAQLKANSAQQSIAKKSEDLDKDLFNRIKKTAGEVSRQLGFDAVEPAFIVNNPLLDITTKTADSLNEKYKARKKPVAAAKPAATKSVAPAA